MNIIKRIVLIVTICFIYLSSIAFAQNLRDVIYTRIVSYNGNEAQSIWITDAILYSSNEYHVDPLLVTAVMQAESAFSFDAFSNVGAIGLMQLMPETAKMIGVDPYDPLQNIIGGTIYLSNQLNNFASWGEYGVTYAVAAYNAGPQAIYQYGGVPPYAETQQYVINVANNYNTLLSWYYS